jgi:transcriptional regulator with XRE-family HTH domain
MASFGEKLKGAREAAGLTQAQLADQSGIPLGTIREYEQNKREPLVSKAGKLAHALKQPMETLLPDASNQPEGKPARAKPAAKKPAKRTTRKRKEK